MMLHFRFCTADLIAYVASLHQVHLRRRDQHIDPLDSFCYLHLRLSYPSGAGEFPGLQCGGQFSFYVNARFTFKQSTTTRRYLLYVGFMGLLSILTGWGRNSAVSRRW